MAYYGWEDIELDKKRDGAYTWLYDAKESFPPTKPLDMWSMLMNQDWYMQYGVEKLYIPTNKGFTWRLVGCNHYFSIIETTEEERRQREPIYKEKIKPWIDNFEAEWKKAANLAMSYYKQEKEVNLEKLDDIGLMEHFEEFQDAMCNIAKKTHWIPFYAAFNIFVDFERASKELLGFGDEHPQFKALMSGFENRVYQSDREFWKLANSARKLGLEKVFREIPDDKKLLSHLEQMDGNGKKWLKELRDVLWEEGWRCPGHVRQFSNPSWVEEPSDAIAVIRSWLPKEEFTMDKARESLARRREEVQRELLAKIPPDRRDWFLRMLKAAQWQGRWNEEHQFYCENYWNAIGRRVTKAIGKRFAERGIIKEAGDLYFLFPNEILLRFTDNKMDAHKLVEIRKKQYEEFCKNPHPQEIIIGNPDDIPRLAAADVLLRVLLMPPVVKAELKADLYGAGSSPGVAEGIARVIFNEAQFSEVQPGDLLVCVYSNPMWTPLFGIVKGVVTDFGGSLSHAVIVGRESGIPVVAGVQEGTKKIKTGDRITIDGDNGAVYILEKR